MRNEKKNSLMAQETLASLGPFFFVFHHAVLLLQPVSLSFVPPPTLSPFPPCEQSFTAGCCGGGGGVVFRCSSSSSSSPVSLSPVRRSPFHCPSSLAASTCNPPHEQWLAGLGWVLAVHRCSSIIHPPCKQGLAAVGSPRPVLGRPRHGCAVLTLFRCYNIVYI
jgi:hypothetical protein